LSQIFGKNIYQIELLKLHKFLVKNELASLRLLKATEVYIVYSPTNALFIKLGKV